MRNIVLILGAGASYEYKAPLMKDFFAIATQIYCEESKGNNKLRKKFDLVFQFINRLQKAQAKASINLHNIEQIYSALEMAKLLRLDSLKVGTSWKELDDAMRYFLTKTIEHKVVMQHSPCFIKQSSENRYSNRTTRNIDNVINELMALKKNNWNVSIVTFNYDLVVESILAAQRVGVNYQLDKNETPDLRDIPLLKLHGSINWERHTSGNKSFISATHMHPKSGNNFSNPKFSVQGDDTIKSMFCEWSTPFVIPPVWNKTTYQTQLGEVWRSAATYLSQASHIYALGYSLPETDGFFKHLYALGTIGDLPLLEFGVYDIENPNRENGVKQRYLSMLGRGSENVFEYSDNGAVGLALRLTQLRQHDI